MTFALSAKLYAMALAFCTFNVIEEQPVLLPEAERTDCSFGCQVVNRNISVDQEDFELHLVVKAVIQAF